MRVEFSSIAFFFCLILCFLVLKKCWKQMPRPCCGYAWCTRHLWCLEESGSSPCSASVAGACGRKGHVVRAAGEEVCSWISHVMLSASAFCGVSLLLLASLFSCRLFHSPAFIRATYAGSSNMLACSFLKAVPAGLGELPYQHLKL